MDVFDLRDQVKKRDQREYGEYRTKLMVLTAYDGWQCCQMISDSVCQRVP